MPFIKDPTFYDVQKIRNNMSQVAKSTEEQLDAVKRYISGDLAGIVGKYALAMTKPEKAKIMKSLKIVQDLLKKPRLEPNEAAKVESEINVINTTTYMTTKPVNRESVNENIRLALKKILFSAEVLKTVNTKRLAELEFASKAHAATASLKGSKEDEDEDSEMFWLQAKPAQPKKKRSKKSRWALWLAILLLIIALVIYHKY